MQEVNMETFSSQDFGSVRIIQKDDECLFCGTDIARALGYGQPHKGVSNHCRYGKKCTVPHPQSASKYIEMIFIPEGDVYRLIAHSRLPSTERFEKWVFDEVLPSIRKHGGYITDNVLNNPDLLEQALTALKAEREKRAELEAKNAIQLDIIHEMEPKVSYYDIILQAKNAVPITLIAKDYGMSATRMNRLLHKLGIQYPVGGTWMLYQKYAGEGYTVTHTYPIGWNSCSMHTCWTQKGRLFLYELLCDNDIYPIMEGRF